MAALSIVGCTDDPAGPPTASPPLFTFGNGVVADRYTGEVWVRGNVAYTTTWGFRTALGNAIKIWDVAGDVPTLVNTVIVPNATTLGDVQVSDDGQLLIVATEYVTRLDHDLQPGRSGKTAADLRATRRHSPIPECTPRKSSASMEGSTRSSRWIRRSGVRRVS